MALVGNQALSYRSSSCNIFMFSTDKSLELQCHLERDKQPLRPSHIIYVNYLDLDQAYATHECQVLSNFLYQNSLIQNSGEFKAKNQVLEGNYNRATIHHFHHVRSSSSSIYLLSLKNKLKHSLGKLYTHSFYLVSIIFLDHTIVIYI